MNMMKMMKQAQELQAKAAKLQADLAARQYTAEAAGGQIKAVATGEGQLVSLKIDPALLKDDVEMLEDLIVTAVREAIDKGKADAAKELGKLMPAGMGGLPGF
jgi:DNA-binding YbaB/EbfC family protein